MIVNILLFLKTIITAFFEWTKNIPKTILHGGSFHEEKGLRMQLYMKLVKNILDVMGQKEQSQLQVRQILKGLSPNFFIYFPDDLIKKLNDILDPKNIQREQTNDLENLCQNLLIQIRKEVFTGTQLTQADIRFIGRIE